MTRRLLPGLLAACLLALVTAVPAHAYDRVDRVTAALRQSPLFVDPDVSYLLNAQDRASLSREIATAGVPIYIAVVPLVSADESGGEGDYLAYLLHQRLGRPGVYIVAGQRNMVDWRSYQVPRDDTLSYEMALGDGPLPGRLHDIVGALAKAPSASPSDPRTPNTPDAGESDEKPSTGGLIGKFFAAFALAVFLGGLALGVLWLLGALVYAIYRGVHASSPSHLKGRKLRRTATAQLVRLAGALGETSGNAGHTRAMADYDAAKLLYDEQDDAGSLVGVIALSLDGQDALREETAHPAARCLLNPFHGPAAGKSRTDLPGLPRADWPLCAVCRKAGRKGRRPLLVATGGTMRPYYQAPGLWEKIRGKSGDLPERVLEYLGVE